ncbi:MAG: hypothetical protein ACI9CA_000021 [Natronomonas sp.]|jgi:hypothetical protein
MNATGRTHDSTERNRDSGETAVEPHPFAGASIPTARDAIAYARNDDRLAEVERDNSPDSGQMWFEGSPPVVRAFADATGATTVVADGRPGCEQVGIERGTPERPDADPEKAAEVRAALLRQQSE